MTTDDAGARAGDFKVPATVLFSEVDSKMVLLNVETEQYYSLDPVGANIVTRLTAQPFDEAFESLFKDYDVAVDVLQRDVDDLINELLAARLLERVAREG